MKGEVGIGKEEGEEREEREDGGSSSRTEARKRAATEGSSRELLAWVSPASSIICQQFCCPKTPNKTHLSSY